METQVNYKAQLSLKDSTTNYTAEPNCLQHHPGSQKIRRYTLFQSATIKALHGRAHAKREYSVCPLDSHETLNVPANITKSKLDKGSVNRVSPEFQGTSSYQALYMQAAETKTGRHLNFTREGVPAHCHPTAQNFASAIMAHPSSTAIRQHSQVCTAHHISDFPSLAPHSPAEKVTLWSASQCAKRGHIPAQVTPPSRTVKTIWDRLDSRTKHDLFQSIWPDSRVGQEKPHQLDMPRASLIPNAVPGSTTAQGI